MPRVLRILNRLIIGGPSLNAVYLTRDMYPEFETRLVVGDKDSHEQDADHLLEGSGISPAVIPEMKRAIDPVSDRKAYLRMKKIIRDFRPDIVHTHAAKSGAIGRLAAHACKVPVVVHTFHGHVFHSYFGRMKTRTFIGIERYLAARSTGIVAISEKQKHELAHVYRICAPEKIRIIPLGLDLQRFTLGQDEKREHFRRQTGIRADELAIGIVGRIVPVKNHRMFAEAAALVQKACAGARVRFVIVGDGDMRPEMEQAFRELGVNYEYAPDRPSDAVAVCTSWQTDMDRVFAGLDIVALTSLNEGTPVSLIEAQAAGKPVVSTNVGGVADVVLPDSTGFIADKGDPEAFAACLIRLVNEERLRRVFGSSGRDNVLHRFSKERLVNDMGAYYRELLDASRS